MQVVMLTFAVTAAACGGSEGDEGGGTTSSGDPGGSGSGADCSVSLAGRYGFVLNGTDGPDPFVAGGVLTLDEGGGFSIEGNQSVDGEVGAAAPATGEYTIGDNCRGSAVDSAGDRIFEFSPVGDGGELRMIRTDQATVITGLAKKAADTCSPESIAGSYGYGFNAIVYLDQPDFPTGPSPFAGGGVVTVGDSGELSLTDTASIAGKILDRRYSGTVDVKSDCTASGSVTLPDKAPTSANPVNVDIVFVDDGNEAFIIQTDPGTFIGGSARRQDLVADGGCSVADTAGRYGFVADGTSDGTPFVAGGVLELLDDGTFTVTGRQSLDGEVGTTTPDAGRWTLDEESCTGTAESDDGPLLAFSAVGDGAELRFIRSDDGNVITGVAKRAAEGCTVDNVAGGYGYAFNATVYLDQEGFPQGPSQFAGGGVVTVDADGTVHLVDSASIAGQNLPREYDGTVEVKADCTGSAAVELPAGAPTSANPVHVDIVWVDDRAEAMVIQNDPGTFIAGPARRQTFP
jgi:hypothetical protein